MPVQRVLTGGGVKKEGYGYSKRGNDPLAREFGTQKKSPSQPNPAPICERTGRALVEEGMLSTSAPYARSGRTEAMPARGNFQRGPSRAFASGSRSARRTMARTRRAADAHPASRRAPAAGLGAGDGCAGGPPPTPALRLRSIDGETVEVRRGGSLLAADLEEIARGCGPGAAGPGADEGLAVPFLGDDLRAYASGRFSDLRRDRAMAAARVAMYMRDDAAALAAARRLGELGAFAGLLELHPPLAVEAAKALPPTRRARLAGAELAAAADAALPWLLRSSVLLPVGGRAAPVRRGRGDVFSLDKDAPERYSGRRFALARDGREAGFLVHEREGEGRSAYAMLGGAVTHAPSDWLFARAGPWFDAAGDLVVAVYDGAEPRPPGDEVNFIIGIYAMRGGAFEHLFARECLAIDVCPLGLRVADVRWDAGEEAVRVRVRALGAPQGGADEAVSPPIRGWTADADAGVRVRWNARGDVVLVLGYLDGTEYATVVSFPRPGGAGAGGAPRALATRAFATGFGPASDPRPGPEASWMFWSHSAQESASVLAYVDEGDGHVEAERVEALPARQDRWGTSAGFCGFVASDRRKWVADADLWGPGVARGSEHEFYAFAAPGGMRVGAFRPFSAGDAAGAPHASDAGFGDRIRVRRVDPASARPLRELTVRLWRKHCETCDECLARNAPPRAFTWA